MLGLAWLSLGAFCLGAPTAAAAFETDQYLALEAEIADSGPVVNRYLNAELEQFLAHSAIGSLECRQVPVRFYRHLFQGLLSSRLQNFLKTDSAVDLFPEGLSYGQHLKRSIYRRPSFPFVLPLSRTIRIGEVRFGLDKFGHLFGFGRRYYKRFMRARRRGAPDHAALRGVVLRGLRMERYFVGGVADGVFSYGDLEANYQGMRLAVDFCEGARPVLRRDSDRWSIARPIDLREYVTPTFDESYSNNYYPWPRWNKVRPILAGYCELYFSDEVQARMKRYARMDRPNPSKRIIADYFEGKGRDPQRQHSMAAICDRGAQPNAQPRPAR